MTIVKAYAEPKSENHEEQLSLKCKLDERILRRLLNTGYPPNKETVEKAIELANRIRKTFRISV